MAADNLRHALCAGLFNNHHTAIDQWIEVSVIQKRAARDLHRAVLHMRSTALLQLDVGGGSLVQRPASNYRLSVCDVDVRKRYGRLEVCPVGEAPFRGGRPLEAGRIAAACSADGNGGGRSVDAARNPVLCHRVRCDGGGDDGIGVRVRECAERHRARREGGEDAWGKCP